MKAKCWPCRSVGNRTDRMTEGRSLLALLRPAALLQHNSLGGDTRGVLIRPQRPSCRSASGISRSDMRDGPVRLGAFFMGLDPRELDVHAQEVTRVWRKLE